MFLILLVIKRPLIFAPRPMSASGFPGKSKTSEICVGMNTKVNKFHIFDLRSQLQVKQNTWFVHLAVMRLDNE